MVRQAALDEPAHGFMAQVVEVKIGDSEALEDVRPDLQELVLFAAVNGALRRATISPSPALDGNGTSPDPAAKPTPHPAPKTGLAKALSKTSILRPVRDALQSPLKLAP